MSKIKAVLRGDAGWRTVLERPEPRAFTTAKRRVRTELSQESDSYGIYVPDLPSAVADLSAEPAQAYYEPAGFGVDLPLPDEQPAGPPAHRELSVWEAGYSETARPSPATFGRKQSSDERAVPAAPVRSMRERADGIAFLLWRGGRPGWAAVVALLALGAANVGFMALVQDDPRFDEARAVAALGYGALAVLVLGRLRGSALLVWPALLAALLVPPALNANERQLNSTLDYGLAFLVLPGAFIALRAWRGPRRRVEGSENDALLFLGGGLALIVIGAVHMKNMQGYVLGLDGYQSDGVGIDARWTGAALIVLGVYVLRHSSTGKHSTVHADCGAPYKGRRLCTRCGLVIHEGSLEVSTPLRRSWLCF